MGRQWEPVKEARGWPGLHPPLAAGPALALTRPAQGRVRTTLDCGQQTGAGLGAPGSPADSDPRLHGPGPALGIYEGSPNGPNASTGRDTARPGTRLLRAPALAPRRPPRRGRSRRRCAPRPGRLGPPRVPRRRRPAWRAYDPAGEPCCSPGASPFPPCARVSAASSLARWPRSSSLPPPDGHQPHQGPARAVDLGRGALHVTPLLAGLEVLAPAAVLHLPQQQEGAGPGDFRTGGPADRHQTRTPSGGRGRLRAAGLPPRLPATGAKGHR